MSSDNRLSAEEEMEINELASVYRRLEELLQKDYTISEWERSLERREKRITELEQQLAEAKNQLVDAPTNREVGGRSTSRSRKNIRALVAAWFIRESLRTRYGRAISALRNHVDDGILVGM